MDGWMDERVSEWCWGVLVLVAGVNGGGSVGVGVLSCFGDGGGFVVLMVFVFLFCLVYGQCSVGAGYVVDMCVCVFLCSF